MADNSLAMMPWFPRDFIAATRAMRIAERCAYRELLDFQWELGVLPNDEVRLARLIGFTDAEFADAWPGIKHKFVDHDGGLINKRLEEHRFKALEQRDKKRKGAEIANAKRGAQRGAQRDAERPAQRSAERSGQRVASATPPSPSPSPSVEEIHTHRAGARAQDDHTEFLKLQNAYPPFAGRQDWLMAEHGAALRVEQGSTWAELLEGVQRYAAYVAAGGVSSTAHVLTPAKFFGAADKPWAQPWELPTAIARAAPQGWRPDPADDPPLEVGANA